MTGQLPLDHIRAGQRAKRRGKVGENEVARIFRSFGWIRCRRNLEHPQYGRDLLDGPPGTRISVKRTERLKLREAFAECSQHAAPGEIPIVVHRANDQPWLCTLELDELLPLLQLREHG